MRSTSSDFDDDITASLLLCNDVETFKRLLAPIDINNTFIYSGEVWNLVHFLIHMNKIICFKYLLTVEDIDVNYNVDDLTPIERVIKNKSANVFFYELLKKRCNLSEMSEKNLGEMYSIICNRYENDGEIGDNNLESVKVAEEIYKIYNETMKKIEKKKKKKKAEFLLRNLFLFLQSACEKKKKKLCEENVKFLKKVIANNVFEIVEVKKISVGLLSCMLELIDDNDNNEIIIELLKFYLKIQKNKQKSTFQPHLIRCIEKKNYEVFAGIIENSHKLVENDDVKKLLTVAVEKKNELKFIELLKKSFKYSKVENTLLKSIHNCIKSDNHVALLCFLKDYEKINIKMLLKVIRYTHRKKRKDVFEEVLKLYSKYMSEKFHHKDWDHYISICFKHSDEFLTDVARFSKCYNEDSLLFPIKIALYNDNLKILKEFLSVNQNIPLENIFLESVKTCSFSIVKGFYGIKFPREILEEGIYELVPSANCELIENFLALHKDLRLGKSLFRCVKIGNENVFASLMRFLNSKQHSASMKRMVKVLKELKTKTKVFSDYFQLCYCLLINFEMKKEIYDEYFKFFLRHNKLEFALDLFTSKKISMENEDIIDFLNEQNTFFIEILQEILKDGKYYPNFVDTILKACKIGQTKIVKLMQKHASEFPVNVIEACFEFSTKRNLLTLVEALFEYKTKEIDFIKSFQNAIINENLGVIQKIFHYKEELKEEVPQEMMNELLDYSLQHLRYAISKKRLYIKDSIFFYFISKNAIILSNNLYEFLDTTPEILKCFIKRKKTNIVVLGNQKAKNSEFPLFCVGNDWKKIHFLIRYGLSNVYDKSKDGKSILHFYQEKNEENTKLFEKLFETHPRLLLQTDKDGKFPKYFFNEDEVKKLVSEAEKLHEKKTVKQVNFKMKIGIKGLPKMDQGLFGKCDSFFEIKIGEKLLYRSSVVKKNYNPSWGPFEFSLPFGTSVKHRFVIDVFSWEKKDVTKPIGSFEFYFIDVIKERNISYSIVNERGDTKHVVNNKSYHPMFSFDSVVCKIIDKEVLNPKKELLEKITFRFSVGCI